MADRALRGMQIGSKSLETEDGVIFADRFEVRYLCPKGHDFEIAFAAEAQPPQTWECRCGEEAEAVEDVPEPEEQKAPRPQRTHWDMLLERRSLEELDVLLNEQLEAYRAGDIMLEVPYHLG